MSQERYFFDFDSTFIQVESFSILAELSLADIDKSQAERIIAEIDTLTEDCMSGLCSFSDALKRRLALLPLNHSHVKKAADILKTKITPSFQKHSAFFKKYAEQIFIISGGFYELIKPIANEMGIQDNHIFANHLFYNYEGQVVGLDCENPLSQDQGKIKQLKHLDFAPGSVTMIGDGYNDYEVKEAGYAHTFYAFTENITRPSVVEKADAVIKDLDGFFLLAQIEFEQTKQSKNVLLLENIHESVQKYFLSKGYTVQSHKAALPESELIEALQDVHILGIRSKTKISDKVLKATPSLEAIGAFCIGTNQINLQQCLTQGIAVFNAPFSNTRSVVELALAEIIILMRRAAALNRKINQGIWDKSSQGAHEIRGKILGIIGYGNIGTQLSILAEAMGMQVIFYDIEEKLPLGNAKSVTSQNEVFAHADVVSIHIDGRKDNNGIIGNEQFMLMRKDAIFLNLSRDSVVNQDALVSALKQNKIAGAGIDVFPNEPHQSGSAFESELLQFENVFLTPHIGGSTMEAQKHIGEYVSRNLHGYSTYGSSIGSVNFPTIELPAIATEHRLIHIHKNLPGVLAKINSELANFQNNIDGQSLKTNQDIGYVITDINHTIDEALMTALAAIPNTIRVRKLN